MIQAIERLLAHWIAFCSARTVEKIERRWKKIFFEKNRLQTKENARAPPARMLTHADSSRARRAASLERREKKKRFFFFFFEMGREQRLADRRHQRRRKKRNRKRRAQQNPLTNQKNIFPGKKSDSLSSRIHNRLGFQGLSGASRQLHSVPPSRGTSPNVQHFSLWQRLQGSQG